MLLRVLYRIFVGHLVGYFFVEKNDWRRRESWLVGLLLALGLTQNTACHRVCLPPRPLCPLCEPMRIHCQFFICWRWASNKIILAAMAALSDSMPARMGI